jgi:hypothetical protein
MRKNGLTEMTMILAHARLRPIAPTMERIRTRGPAVRVEDLKALRTSLRLFRGVFPFNSTVWMPYKANT